MIKTFIITFVAGFLKTGTKGSAQGNYGLMDLVAGLHWLRENLPAFGGDPERITLMGHGTGAAIANFIAVSPVAKGNEHFLLIKKKITKRFIFLENYRYFFSFYSACSGVSYILSWIKLFKEEKKKQKK